MLTQTGSRDFSENIAAASDIEGQAGNTTPYNLSEKEAPHLYALFKQTLSISPNDVFNAICVMVAASFMAHLDGLSSADSASVGAISATTYTVARVVGSSHQIAALFTIKGVDAKENSDGSLRINIDPPALKQSLIQLFKIGLIDSTIAAAFLLAAPSIYGLIGTPPNIVEASQNFAYIALVSLYPQILNVGLQQTLFKMDKHRQLVHGAFIYLSLTLGSLLTSQLAWGPLTDVQNIALSFVIGTSATFAFYLRYLASKDLLPSAQEFLTHLNKDPNAVFADLFHNGNPIAIQLLSELLIVTAMSVMATIFISGEYQTDALSILNFANTINLTAVVPTITLAQAGCNLMDSYVKLYRNSGDERYLAAIRKIADTTLLGGLIYNAILFVILVAAAPQIASFFYNPKDIEMPGISQNPYILAAILGIGLLINSRRDLCLFMQRSLGIFGLSAKSSIITLWVINIPVAIALCNVPLDLNVAGILLAYYAVAVPIGAAFLRYKLYEALSSDNLQAVLDSDHPQHTQTLANANSAITKWCCIWKQVDQSASQTNQDASRPLLQG